MVPNRATWLTMAPNSPVTSTDREAVTASEVASDASRTVVVRPAPRRIVGVLLLGICLLVLAGIASNALKYTLGNATIVHPGPTDENGCHKDERGRWHCH